MALINVLTDIKAWIISALVFGIIVGDVGDLGPTIIVVSLMAMMSISLMGLDLSKKDITEKKKELVLAFSCCYVFACIVTLAVGSFFEHALWNGWALIASVPCAVSVVSGTLILKGDVKLSLISVTLIYVAAIGITPLMTKLLVGDAVSPLEILRYVLMFILMPMIVSLPLRKITLTANARSITVNFFFFVLVMVSFGANREFLFASPHLVLMVAAGCLVRIVAVHGAAEYIFKRIGIDRETRIVLVLLCIWKNSALAMTLAILLLPDAESALPGALSVPLELVWFMAMVWFYKVKCPPERTEGNLAAHAS